MSDEIDLTIGEPDPDESPAARRRRERRSSRGDSGGSSRARGSSGGGNKDDAGLVARLDTAFTKLADQMAARDDDELAEAIRDERHAMSQGLVSLTAGLPFLRPFVVLVLALAEPVLAFWRVGRILFYRFLGWRERRIVAAQQREWEAQQQAEQGAVVS